MPYFFNEIPNFFYLLLFFSSQPLKHHYFVLFRCGFDYAIIWRVFFSQSSAQSPNPCETSGRFRRGMVVLWKGYLFFLYLKCIHFRKNTILSSKLLKHHLSHFVAGSILYQFGGSSLHNII
jgi:hypothetical protein